MPDLQYDASPDVMLTLELNLVQLHREACVKRFDMRFLSCKPGLSKLIAEWYCMSLNTYLSTGTPLHYAVEHCKGDHVTDIIKLLITKGNADVNAGNKWSRTSLFGAIKNRNKEAADILLTNGAKTDVMGYNETPLHYACRFCEADIIKLIITKGKADVNAVDKENRTPLFHVVKWSSEIVNILLTNGAKTDVVNNFGNTPLLLAIEKGRSTEVIKLLITKGKADVTAVCEKYHINSKLSRSEIAELLITKMPKLHSPESNRSSEEENIPLEPLELENVESRQTKPMSSPWLDRQEMSTSPLYYHDETSAELQQTHDRAPYRPEKTTA
uniref:Uncharacterized protein n=1 Tax=Amphimedon queenslandica TaxID=400682 RepID=A0A1X7UYQ3_AMPQE